MTILIFISLTVLTIPYTGYIDIPIPEGAKLDTSIATDIHWSGTISTISLDEYQAKELREEKVRTERNPGGLWLKVNYEGEDSDGFHYHAFTQYSSPDFLRTYETTVIDGNTIRYTTGKKLGILGQGFFGVLVGLIISIVCYLVVCIPADIKKESR